MMFGVFSRWLQGHCNTFARVCTGVVVLVTLATVEYRRWLLGWYEVILRVFTLQFIGHW